MKESTFKVTIQENGGGNMPEIPGKFYVTILNSFQKTLNGPKLMVYDVEWHGLNMKNKLHRLLQNYNQMWRYTFIPPSWKHLHTLERSMFLGDLDYKVLFIKSKTQKRRISSQHK